MLGVPDAERPASRGYPAGIPRSGPVVIRRNLRAVLMTRDFVSGRTAEYRVGSLHTAEVGGSSPLAPTSKSPVQRAVLRRGARGPEAVWARSGRAMGVDVATWPPPNFNSGRGIVVQRRT